ncbi:MAG: zinc ribbon domain-containing protein [Planctomycetaceae bacterium]|jgi:predicted  nucleic acid-binding Zn-ribbon protein
MSAESTAAEMSQGLHQLKQLLKQLDVATERLEEGPRRIRVSERMQVKAEAAVEQQEENVKALRKKSDELNLSLKAREAEIAKLEGQLNTASSNREYDTIRSQIAAAVTAREEIEEQGLLALEAIDQGLTELQECRQRVQETVAEVTAAREANERDTPVLQAEVVQLEEQITAASGIVPAVERPTLQRLRTAHGAAALAALEDDFCTACDTRVIAQDQVLLRTGNCLLCRDCGRILYLLPRAE